MPRTRIFRRVDCAKADTRATRAYELKLDELVSIRFYAAERADARRGRAFVT